MKPEMKCANDRIVYRFAVTLLGLSACIVDSSVTDNEPIDSETRALLEAAAPSLQRSITCGKAGDPLPGGHARLYDETYLPDMLSKELELIPELQDRFGSARVETCEDARRLGELKISFLEELAPTDREESSELSSSDQVGVAIQPIWQGINLHHRAMVMILLPAGACSGVMITPRHVLTAAHCLPTNINTCGGLPCRNNVGVQIRRSTGLGSSETTHLINAVTRRHEMWSGLGDPEDDIGLVALSESVQPTADCRAMSLVNPAAGQIRQVVGAWGSQTQFSPGNAGTLRQPRGDTTFSVDFAGPLHFLDDNDTDVRMCAGDSGSPAMLNGQPIIQGVLSEIEIATGRICSTENGQKQRWTTVGPKIGWIEARLSATANFTCPSSGSTCCHRQSNNTVARCF